MIRFKQFLLEQNVYNGGLNQPATAEEPEDYSSSAYFDDLDNRFSRLKKGERVDLSPIDVMSMQFGRDRVKERDEYINQLRDYHSKHTEIGRYVDVPTLSDEHLKQKIPVVPKKSEETKNKNLDLATHRPETSFFLKQTQKDSIDDEQIERVKKLQKQPEDIKTSSYIMMAPKVGDLQSDQEIKNVLSHEFWHRLAFPDQIKNLKKKQSENIEPQHPYDFAKKYNIEPNFKIPLDTMEKKLEAYESDTRKEIKDIISTEKDKMAYTMKIIGLSNIDINDSIKSETDPSHNPASYYWNRGEVPAFMHQLKLDLMQANNEPYRTSKQSDEEIEADAAFLMNNILDVKNFRDKNKVFHPAKIKALELLKTPEGKAIWRGVEKTKPQMFDNSTRMT